MADKADINLKDKDKKLEPAKHGRVPDGDSAEATDSFSDIRLGRVSRERTLPESAKHGRVPDGDSAEANRDEAESSTDIKITNPIWLSVSEAAKLGGVQNKTIRRAIQSKVVKFKIIKNRYLVDLHSLIIYLHTKTKLKNKLAQFGIGQYVERWIKKE